MRVFAAIAITLVLATGCGQAADPELVAARCDEAFARGDLALDRVQEWLDSLAQEMANENAVGVGIFTQNSLESFAVLLGMDSYIVENCGGVYGKDPVSEIRTGIGPLVAAVEDIQAACVEMFGDPPVRPAGEWKGGEL